MADVRSDCTARMRFERVEPTMDRRWTRVEFGNSSSTIKFTLSAKEATRLYRELGAVIGAAKRGNDA